ncbi:cation:proton antiporter [Nocardioides sp. 1609]|uniref:cation:proton antiporter n=1 Tax=Nocardioides sp. 1609 TaxID=2508327 RepID=UPI00107028D0|nr:cation:proton antiporter [Nocardioides sp. 1609]
MEPAGYFLLAGTCLLVAVALPTLLHRYAVSPAMVLLLVGVVVGLTPLSDGLVLDVSDHHDRAIVEHVTELTVLVALMGVGLAIDRPLDLLRPSTWRTWSPTWRLLALALPACVAAVALLGWAALGLAPATALLLGAVLSPTDPVLASDVQVGGPGSSIADDEPDEVPYAEDQTTSTESSEIRFALTSEAGLNDGLAFPFVHAAVLVLAGGSFLTGAAEWASWYVVGKLVLGVLVGVLIGRGLGRLAFRAKTSSLRLAEQGEPLLALAALLTTYGVAELVRGYGFIAVFACAMALRAAEHRHDYHRAMHDVVQRLERLLTLVVLLLLGIALSSGLLDALDWRGVVAGTALVLLIRPLTAWLSLSVLPRTGDRAGGLDRRARLAVAFFGIRGVGSLYYVAWATSHAEFTDADWVWATVGFTVAFSVLVHGVTATPVMRRIESEPA